MAHLTYKFLTTKGHVHLLSQGHVLTLKKGSEINLGSLERISTAVWMHGKGSQLLQELFIHFSEG